MAASFAIGAYWAPPGWKVVSGVVSLSLATLATLLGRIERQLHGLRDDLQKAAAASRDPRAK